MPSPSRLSLLLLVGVLTGACEMVDKPSWIATKQANDAEANFYAEETADGRLYVIGKSASLQTFKATGELPISHSFIGMGPEGQTVVLEADAKDPALQARLRRTFEEKHDIDLN